MGWEVLALIQSRLMAEASSVIVPAWVPKAFSALLRRYSLPPGQMIGRSGLVPGGTGFGGNQASWTNFLQMGQGSAGESRWAQASPVPRWRMDEFTLPIGSSNRV